jgi:hypothetical protein
LGGEFRRLGGRGTKDEKKAARIPSPFFRWISPQADASVVSVYRLAWDGTAILSRKHFIFLSKQAFYRIEKSRQRQAVRIPRKRL